MIKILHRPEHQAIDDILWTIRTRRPNFEKTMPDKWTILRASREDFNEMERYQFEDQDSALADMTVWTLAGYRCHIYSPEQVQTLKQEAEIMEAMMDRDAGQSTRELIDGLRRGGSDE